MLPAPDVVVRADSGSEILRTLFHRLNNQLGIVLANAELIESRVADRMAKARAAQVIDSALEAMATVRELRGRIDSSADED
jgi:hypothetical protein